MNHIEQRFASLGIKLPELLLPVEEIDMEKWAVIACDQFSSEQGYWEKVKELVGESPSTLNLILPECYLGKETPEDHVASINAAMREYLQAGVFRTLSPGFVLVERNVASLPPRYGIVLAVDLEYYDFNKGSQSLIRPTEGTILERLPPRIKIREEAALDLPHILFLIDDPEGTVIEQAAERKEQMELLYDFDLMQGGGHLSGRKMDDPDILMSMLEALEKLAGGKDLLFAVGDGNHSLATAKSIWDNIKGIGGNGVMNHPARWALVEIENIYSPGLIFEPIHRVLFNARPEFLLARIDQDPACSLRDVRNLEEMHRIMEGGGEGHRIGFVTQDRTGIISMDGGETTLAAEAVQDILDRYIEENSEVDIDYIHGDDTVTDLGRKPGNIGFFLPPLDKGTFFDIIIEKGALPRKTFSLGEAKGKRYYLEAGKLLRDL